MFVDQTLSGAPSFPLTLFRTQLLLEKQWFKAVAFLLLSEPEITHSQYIKSHFLLLMNIWDRENFLIELK